MQWSTSHQHRAWRSHAARSQSLPPEPLEDPPHRHVRAAERSGPGVVSLVTSTMVVHGVAGIKGAVGWGSWAAQSLVTRLRSSFSYPLNVRTGSGATFTLKVVRPRLPSCARNRWSSNACAGCTQRLCIADSLFKPIACPSQVRLASGPRSLCLGALNYMHTKPSHQPAISVAGLPLW